MTTLASPVLDARSANAARVAELLAPDRHLLVGGELVGAEGGRTFDVVGPYGETVIARVPDATAGDARRAVDAARAAAPGWAARSAGERADLVRALADRIEERGEDLALLDVVDGGAPVAVMQADVRMACEALRYFAGLALEIKGSTTPASTGLHYTERQPYGVVARITPFNHPLMFAASKIAAPLVAGNTVVLKPSEATPLSALVLGELCREVLPPGVVNVVVGNGPEVPDALVRSPHVHRIGFTGSEAVGRAIQRSAAEAGVKAVTLELGGKNALVAFPDADPAAVAAAAVAGMNFTWSGQSCGSTSRLVVHASIADEVVARVAALLSDREFVDPLDPAAVQGTMVNRRQYERVLGLVDAAVAEGARVAAGGGRPPGVATGLFVAPTVLDGVLPVHRIAGEEVFGPVLSVLRFQDEQEAVTIANGVRYGLTGSVFTNDLARAHRVARALETGYVWLNHAGPHYLGMPYGGWKSSGTGSEESLDELLSYTQLKAVHLRL